MIRSRHEPARLLCIQEMVRLSGKSLLYLPQDYSPCSLVLPTCLRATAQYLAQNTNARGVFRVPGSVRVVSALFDHYCHMESGGDDITRTVRSANLPLHIAYSVHDVASTFKRLLSVLPGGILGSLALFDALVAIHSQLNGEPEFPRTKQTKVRARLIALAIGAIKSQFRRELVCAVLGLLSLIGRVAELTPREDGDGRPLPTTDLMGYHALGIVFGPLLMGDMLDQYTMKLAAPTAGMLLLPLSPQKLLRDRRKAKADLDESGPPTVNRILVANSIAEMLIANWRDVVRQMKALGTHDGRDVSVANLTNPSLRQSASQPFTIRMPQETDATEGTPREAKAKRRGTPEPDTPTSRPRIRRPVSLMRAASHRLLPKMSVNTLSPTKEESLTDDDEVPAYRGAFRLAKKEAAVGGQPPKPTVTMKLVEDEDAEALPHKQHMAASSIVRQSADIEERRQPLRQPKETAQSIPRAHTDTVPPRVSSKPRHEHGSSETTQSYSRGGLTELPSPDHPGGRPGGLQGRFRKARSSNNVGSCDDSENSAGLFYSPRCDTNGHQSGFLSPEERRISRICNALSPHRHGTADFECKAVWSVTEASESKASRNGPPHTSEGNSLDEGAEGSAPNHPSTTPQNYVNGRRTDGARRNSISSTPEHLYPRARVRQQLQWTRSRDAQSSAQSDNESRRDRPSTRGATSISEEGSENADGHAVPHGLDLVKHVEPGQEAKPDARRGDYEQNPPQVTSYEKSPLSSRCRTFRSTGQWRSPIRFLGQSPTQSSSSALSKRGSVRAMAALFKSQGSAEDTATSAGSPAKGKNTDEASFKYGPAGLGTRRDDSDKSAKTCSGGQAAIKNYTSRTSDGNSDTDDGQSTRAVDGGTSSAPSIGGRRWTPAPEAGDQGTILCGRLKPAQSLGTMVPCRAQPPIAQHSNFAQHSNLARPLSTPAAGRPVVDGAPTAFFTPPAMFDVPTRSTTVLYAQVQSLQRNLSAKADEASQLRRQLEAQENAEAGTLSEQLRTAKRDLSMWRERAEAAESRVQVFERFTVRLRGIKAAMSTAQQRLSGRDGDGHDGKHDGALSQPILDQGQASGAKEDGPLQGASPEDAGVVSARMRRCLHGHSSAAAAAAAHGDGLDAGGPGVSGVDGASCPGGEHRCMDAGAAEVWAAAEELLRLEEL